MFQSLFRILLGVMWLLAGVFLLARGALFPPEWFAGKNSATLNLMGFLALVLSGYNLLRWVMTLRRRRAVRQLPTNPLARPRPEVPQEYLPEFDFSTPEPKAEQPPTPDEREKAT